MFSKKCREHLDAAGETPLQHMKNALYIAIKLQALVPTLVIHAFAPRFFTNTATKVMKDICKERDQ
jgi:hypothetical protein